MKIRHLLIFNLLLGYLISQAQVAEYYFAQKSATYTALSNDTVLWSGTFDNDVTTVSIPSILINGETFTSMNVSTNGFITFGGDVPASTNTTPVSGTGNYHFAISAFGQDLKNVAGGSPKISYKTNVSGEIVVQWQDVRRVASTTVDTASFQIRMNPATGSVSIVYGSVKTSYTSTIYALQVGLRGLTNTDFINRTTTSNWSATAAGGTNSATCRFTSSVYPASGLTFSWKPLYNPLNFTAMATGLSQINLAWQQNSLDHPVMLAYNTSNTFGTPKSDTVYTVGQTINGGGIVLFYGDGTSFSHTSLSSNTVYYYKLWSYDAEPDYSGGVAASTRTGIALAYLQDFNATSLPAGWVSDMASTANHGILGTRSLSKRLYSTTPSAYAISPLVGNVSASTYLSFHYRLVNYLGYPYNAATPGAGDKIEILVSTDDGATYSPFYTIDQSNHVVSSDYCNKNLSLAAYSGNFIKIKFQCTRANGDYYADIDHVLIEDGNAMAYIGSYQEHTNFANVGIGSNDNEIIRLQVVTQKSSSPISLTSITVIASGEATLAKIYYTTEPVFSTAVVFSSQVSPGGTFTFLGNQALAPGNNYFWMAYNIKTDATPGNFVDGSFTSFVTSESGSSKSPSNGSPTGNRKVGAILSGTKTVTVDFTTLAAAVTALNNGVIGAGGLTVNIPGGYSENTTTAILLTATGTSSNPILFKKSGPGNKPLITRTDAGSVSTGTIGNHGDGVIILEGSDYVTFDSIDVVTQNQGIEYGYYLRKASVTDGCKNVTVKNASVTMTKGTSRFVIGICASNNSSTSSGISIMSPGGSHEDVILTGNTISNTFSGIYLKGSGDFLDQDFIVGSSGNGNTIINFGGIASYETWGMYLLNQNNAQVSYNNIDNMAGGGSIFGAAGSGIYNGSTGEIDFTAGNNSINLRSASSQLYGLYNSAAGTLQINGNTISLANTGTANTVYAFIYNYQAGATSSRNTTINNNIFSADTILTTGMTYLIYNNSSRVSPEITTIQGNSVADSINRTGTSGNLYFYYNTSAATGTENISGNNFSNMRVTGSSSIFGIYSQTSATHAQNVYNNTISGLKAGTGTITGINLSDAGTRSVYGNVISGIEGGGIVQGIVSGTGSSPGNIYKNEIYNLSSTGSSGSEGIVSGIVIEGGASVYVYNNFISDLRTPMASHNDAIRGISLTSAQTNSNIGVYYNTVYLEAISSGASFGSSGLYQKSSATATTAVLDLRNNLIVNKSIQTGTSYTAAFRRSAETLSNYKSTSNCNVFYAGTPSTYQVICYTTAPKQTIENFRTYVGPGRDSISFSENPLFANITTKPYNLRIQDGDTSYCESGARPVNSPLSILTDFDGESRLSSPDIGADEFTGVAAYVPVPSFFAASPQNSQQVKLDFTSNSGGNQVVIVYNGSGTFTNPSGTPVTGQPLAGGTVLYTGTVSPQIHSGLAPGTAVYYKAFCYNGFNYSFGKTASATPLVPAPAGFTATCAGQSRIDLAWSRNSNNHDVLVTYSGTTFSGNPVNGTVYNAGDAVPSAGTVLYKGSASSFNHDNLPNWSQYFYKIWSLDQFNYYSSGLYANAVTDADTIETIPYLQDFGAGWVHSPAAPSAWKVVDVGGSGSQTWARETGLYYVPPACAEGSGNQDDYLISPPIRLPNENCRLAWFDRVSTASNNNTYRILLSTTTSEPGAFTVALDTFDCSATAWTRHETDLSAYKNQTVFIAFHQYYSATQYSGFGIDEAFIETYNLGPATLEFPSEALLTFTDLELKWNGPIYSKPATGYKVYLGTGPNPGTLIYNGPESSCPVSDLAHNTTYYWKVVPYNEDGDASAAPVWSFSTVTATQLAESFEAPYFPPVSWDLSQQYGWNYSVSSYFHGVQSAIRSTSLNTVRLITPLLEISSGDKLEFFTGTSSSPSLRIQIMYSADNVAWSNFGAPIAVPVAAWGFQSVDLSPLAGNNYYLAFGAYYLSGGSSGPIYLDHVTGPDVVPILPSNATNPDPADGDSFIPTAPLMQWDPVIWGGIPAGYKLYMDTSPNPTTLVYNSDDEYFQAAVLPYNTTFYWKVVPYNSLGDATGCPVWSFTTVPEKGVQIGRETNDFLGLPVYNEYNYSYTQTLYLQSEINIPGSRIAKLYFYWSGIEEGLNYKDWVVYIGHTTKTTFSSYSDWIPVSQMTCVFDGEVSIPDTAGWVEIILDIPFVYNNTNNLVIAVDENTDGCAPDWSYSFFGTETQGVRAMEFHDDITNPNPAGPPDADSYVYGYANIRLQLEDIPTGPVLRITPSVYDFGYIALDSASAGQIIKIKNNGPGSLNIQSLTKTGTDAGQFVLDDANAYPLVLAENQMITVSATFNPTAEGIKSASLTVAHNQSGSPAVVPLSGTGMDNIITSFPFIETFEDNSATRVMWSQFRETGYGDWRYAEGAGSGSIDTAHGGLKNARFTSSPELKISKLVSPVFNLTGVADPRLTFWYGQESYGGDQNELWIYYRTAPGQSWVQLFYDGTEKDSWTADTLSLPNPTATYQLAFEGIDNYGYPNVLDDITVGPAAGITTTWLGTNSSAWTNPSNWSNGVPSSNSEVIINNGTYDPLISTVVTVFKINLSNSAVITVAPGGSLTVTGN